MFYNEAAEQFVLGQSVISLYKNDCLSLQHSWSVADSLVVP